MRHASISHPILPGGQIVLSIDATELPFVRVADNYENGIFSLFFNASLKPSLLKGISFQAISQTTSRYWILAFDQSGGQPNAAAKLHRIGLIPATTGEADGYDWSDFYNKGLLFSKGIAIAVSTEPDRFVSPPQAELFLKVAYQNTLEAV